MIRYFIGRKAPDNYLYAKGNNKIIRLGDANEVPLSVSETHCQLTVHADCRMELKNLKSDNVTYVDNNRIDHVYVQEDSTVELGSTKWNMDFVAVLNRLRQEPDFPVPYKKPLDASYLKKVSDEYQQANMNIEIRDRRLNAYQMLTGFLTIFGIVLGPVIEKNISQYAYIASAIFMIAFFFIRFIDAKKIPLKRERIKADYRKNYICPNKLCKRYIPIGYEELAIQGKCPHCKATLVFEGNGIKSDKSCE